METKLFNKTRTEMVKLTISEFSPEKNIITESIYHIDEHHNIMLVNRKSLQKKPELCEFIFKKIEKYYIKKGWTK